MQPSTHPGRAGRAAPLLLALVLLLGAAGLAWFLGQDGAGGLEAQVEALSGDAPSAPPELQGGAEPQLATPEAAASPGRGGGARPGVRLPGDGHLTGVVLERSSGEPVPGAQVALLGVPPSAAGFLGRALDLTALGDGVTRRVRPAAVASTDAMGRFRFEGVLEGRWYAQVQGAYHLGDGPVRVHLLASGSGGPVTLYARTGGRVLGQVLDPSGAPAAGAQVVLTQGPGVLLTAAASGDLTLLEARTDGEGRFAFPAVPAGEGYEVSAIGVERAAGLGASHAMGVVVRELEDTQVLVQGRAGARLRGRVLSEDGDGRLVPLAGAQVGAVPRGLRHLRLVKELLALSHAVTGPDGTYELQLVPAGEVDVLAMAEDHVPGRGPSVRCVEGGSHGATDLVLVRGPQVEGVVCDRAGQPLDDVQVRFDLVDVGSMAMALSAAPLLAQAMAEFDYPRTDGDGSFKAGALAGPAPHTLTFSKPGFADAQVEVDPASLDGPLQVTLVRGGSLTGRVIDGLTGEPVTRFQLDCPERVETLTEAPGRLNPFIQGVPVEHPEGAFTLEPVAPGQVSLRVTAEGYAARLLENLTVPEDGAAAPLTVELSRGALLRGVVVDPDGAPVAGARVTTDRSLSGFLGRVDKNRRRARGDLGLPLPPIPHRPGTGPDAVLARFAASLGLVQEGVTTTDGEGRFELAGLEPGAHTLLGFHRDWQVGRLGPVQGAEGAPVEGLVLELSLGATLFGQVTDRFSRPLVGAMVVALAPSNLTGRGTGGGGVYQGRTDDEGRYEIRHLEPGGYMAITTRGDEALDPLTLLGSVNLGLVSVPEGQRVRHDIVDTSIGACRVHGRVTEGGEPVTQGSVVAVAFDAPGLLGLDLKITGIDQDGSYAFEGLSPGEYRLQLEGRGPRTRFVVEVPDAPELALDLAVPAGTIEGRVVDARTGEGIPGATVRGLWGEDLEPDGAFAGLMARDRAAVRLRTDSEGRFRLSRLGEGDWELQVQPPRRGEGTRYAPPEPVFVDLAPDEAREDVLLRLEPGLELAGVVQDPSGVPVAGARVLARRSAAPSERPVVATADDQGAFRLRGLAPGKHELTASAEGFASVSLEPLDLSPLETPEPLLVTLRPGVLVTVQVVDGAGQPVAGATARLVPAGDSGAGALGGFGDALRSFFAGDLGTGDDGRLELGRYEAGAYRLEVRKGLASSSQALELESGAERRELRARLP